MNSEHFSIMQLLKNQKIKDIKNLYYCFRGPFLNHKLSSLKNVKPSDTKHPDGKWKKNLKNSTTLMNKMLEIIEAQKLFPLKQIEIVIHPESLVI